MASSMRNFMVVLGLLVASSCHGHEARSEHVHDYCQRVNEMFGWLPTTLTEASIDVRLAITAGSPSNLSTAAFVSCDRARGEIIGWTHGFAAGVEMELGEAEELLPALQQLGATVIDELHCEPISNAAGAIERVKVAIDSARAKIVACPRGTRLGLP